MLSNLSACACLLECLGECFNRTSSATFSILDNLKSSTHYPRAMEVYSNSLRQEFVFSHLRWPQTQAMYDGKCWSARFPDFSPVSKLEIWCEIYFFRRSLATVLPGGRRRLLNSLSSPSFWMCRPLALRPFFRKKGCAAFGNSLIFGGFVPASSAASYAPLIA